MCMNVRIVISGLSPKAIVRVVISGLSPEGICAGYHNRAMSRSYCTCEIPNNKILLVSDRIRDHRS
ncbi:SCL-interrupting protein [Gossypium arboreum]|uniref:SCL-interrupting protein n=1 Tax=Gossypium arboreum TaxID=29729 RepID=A0A0B0NBH5_GOSAR|nr:SCL-interrupting protein [Gossypium arboreum]